MPRDLVTPDYLDAIGEAIGDIRAKGDTLIRLERVYASIQEAKELLLLPDQDTKASTITFH